MREAFRALADGGAQMLVMFVDTRDDIPRTTKFLEGGHVDGALVFAPHAGDPLPTALRLLRVPVVFGGRPGTGKGLYTVDYDNVGGGRLAVSHLIERGRRRIVTVCGPQDHPAAADRLLGWQKQLAEHGMPAEGRAESGDFTQTGGEAAMTRLLARHPDLDAVFAASDPMAAGVLQALRAHGRRVPHDVAVVGFDDNPSIARALTPPLTSVHQDPAEQVQCMIMMLQDLLAAQTPPTKRQVLPISLTVRAST
jgi:DNA-binding LacI/PurR family transcriptional regulator